MLNLNIKNKFQPGFNQEFLKSEEEKEAQQKKQGDEQQFSMTGAQQYLESCSYSINLGQLYMMREEYGTCSYMANMEYTPV